MTGGEGTDDVVGSESEMDEDFEFGFDDGMGADPTAGA